MPALAQRREVVGQRGERRRHHAHGGDAGHDHVEVLVAAGEHGAEDREQAEREQDAEEGRRRVAPEHPALEPELPPRRAPPGHGGRHATASVSSRYTSSRRRARDAQVLERLAARERLGGELVQQRRRVLGEALLERAVAGAPGDAVARGAERVRRALGEDQAVLEDRDAVGERLRLVQVVRGEHDGLAEVAQRADDVPGGAAGGRVEAGRGLVEEDQLRVADEREREVQPPGLAAAERARAAVGAVVEPGQREHLVDLARARVHAPPSARRSRARSDAGRCRSSAGRSRRGRAARGPRVAPEHADLAGVALAVALEHLDARRLAGAVGAEQAEHLAALRR